MSNLSQTPLEGNNSISESPFEQIKRVDPDGNEYWSSRDLVPVFGYANWHRLNVAISDVYSGLCLENSDQNDIVRTSVFVQIGLGAIREVQDWRISHYGLVCILNRVASHKPEAVRELRRRDSQNRSRIEVDLGANLYDFCDHAGLSIVSQYRLEKFFFDFCIADTLLIEVDEMYHDFDRERIGRDQRKNDLAVQHGFKLLRIKIPFDNISKLYGTIFQLLTDSIDETFYAEITQDNWQLVSHSKVSEHVRLTSAVINSGIMTQEDFAIFEDYGYRGLYGDLTAEDIHRRKGLKKSQHILDHMGTTELAANLFRSTQAEEKIKRDNVQGKENANRVHYEAGVGVRRFMQEFGGTMPEDLPTADSIKKLERGQKKRLESGKQKTDEE